jgi:hypothetical protein
MPATGDSKLVQTRFATLAPSLTCKEAKGAKKQFLIIPESVEGLTRHPIVQIVSQLLLSPFTASSSIPCTLSKLHFSYRLGKLYQLRDLT